MLLAVSENMIPGAGYGEKLRFLRDHGYDGIELFPDVAAQETAELKQSMSETGISAPSMRGRTRDLLAADPAARQAQIESLKSVCALAEDCGVGAVIIVPVFGGPNVPDLTPWRSAIELEEALLDTILPTIGDIAANHGVTLVMEPLNRYETHFLNTLAHGAAICQRVGHPNVRVMADFFHMHIEEADIAASLADNLSYVSHVHLADSNRDLPGCGHTDFAPAFRVLKQSGFSGAFALECPRQGTADFGFKECAAYLRKTWQEA
ncbi:MAG: sugar phosphate isomerase/epimerase [Chloroflexota bacterium]|nr:sugar phosphate isomerase/epimerase [Chloroflexota bacterium]